MKFLGKVWRFLVGVKDALVLLLLLLFFGGLYAVLSAKPGVGNASEGALLLDLNGTIVEQPSQSSPLDMLRGAASATRQYRLRDLVHALETAASDRRVKVVAIDLDIFSGGGHAALRDVGAAMDKVRAAGKPVLTYSSGYADDTYQLAAHASEVWLNPLGAVLLAGPGGTGLYYKGLMDKLGITANVYRVGAFKSAVEPYTRSDMSPEARQATQLVADAIWDSWKQDVGHARRRARLAAYIADPGAEAAAAGGDLAQAALKDGLVDRLGDRAQFNRRLVELAGADDKDVPGSFKTIGYDAWIDDHPVARSGKIGILTIAGTIEDGEAGPGSAGAETIAKDLSDGLANKNLKALVVRIDSPGGSALASERIRQSILAAKAKGLPVVVSMGSVAASGGYWVSTVGDKVFAEPETITGSIGVFGILPSFQGTLKKLGLGADGVQTTPLSGEPNLMKGPSAQASQLVQLGIEGTYRRFLTLVSGARHLPVQRVAEIAQGRVWDGGNARQLGLVDQFGSIDDAIAEAARRANLDPGTAGAVWLEPEPSFAERLVRNIGRSDDGSPDVFSRAALRPERLLARAMADVQQMLDGPAIQVRCLECPPVGDPPTPKRGDGSFRARLVALLLQ